MEDYTIGQKVLVQNRFHERYEQEGEIIGIIDKQVDILFTCGAHYLCRIVDVLPIEDPHWNPREYEREGNHK